MRVLSIWDTKTTSARILEESLRGIGHEILSVVRDLIIDDIQPDQNVKFQQSHNTFNQEKGILYLRLSRAISLILFHRFVHLRIREFRPEIIFCHFGQTGSRFIKKAKRLGIPIVIIFYGHDISAALKTNRWRRKYRKFVNYPCTLLVMCKEAGRRLEAIGCSSDKIKQWNLPIDLDNYPYKPKFRSSDLVKVLTCARFVEKKGYPTLLNALQKLNIDGRPVELHALGYGDGIEDLQDLARELEITDIVYWHRDYTGQRFQEKYLELLRESDLFILVPEMAENGDDEGGPPLSLIIAQATGIPIISTRFAGYEITLIDGVTGLICETPVELSIVNYVESYLQDNNRYFQIGKLGAECARKEFDYETQANKLDIILTEIASSL